MAFLSLSEAALWSSFRSVSVLVKRAVTEQKFQVPSLFALVKVIEEET